MHRLSTQENKPDTPEILDQTHVALRQMLLAKQIEDDVYGKNVVTLAARWILLGRTEDASAMVCELDQNYVSHVLPDQMRADPSFRKVAFQVSASLSALPLDLDDDDVALALMLLERPKAKA